MRKLDAYFQIFNGGWRAKGERRDGHVMCSTNLGLSLWHPGDIKWHLQCSVSPVINVVTMFFIKLRGEMKENCRNRTLLDHFTENSFYRFFLTERHLTETPFDQTPFDRTPFDRKAIWPKHHWPNAVWPNTIWPKHHLTERRLTETPFYRKDIWPIFFSENDHLTESTFDKKCHLTEKTIAQKVIWPKIHLTESSFDQKLLLKMVI
jgi:hypothetical protein